MGMQTFNDQPQNPAGKGGSQTFAGQTGQPKFGEPNRYSNTVGPWDNASIVPQQSAGGKNASMNQPTTGGKGGKMQSNPSYPVAPTSFPVAQPNSSAVQANPITTKAAQEDYYDPTNSNWSGA